MLYSTLGDTGIRVSKICLGTMTFGEQNAESDGHEQIDYALDQGINFIDTAELYSVPGRAATQGSTERIIGTWISKNATKRKDIILATKIAGPRAGLEYLRNPQTFSRKHITEALEGSLKRMQTDYVDLYQLHWPERNVNNFGKLDYEHDPHESWQDNLLDVLQSMQAMVDAGKIRYFGVSNETPWGLMKFLSLAEKHGLPRCVSIQNPFSLLNRSFEVGLSEISMRESVGLLAYSPLGFGRLSGKYHYGTAKEADRIHQFKQLSRYNGKRSVEATAAYIAIAEEHGLDPAQMALAFVNSQPFLTSNIIGATTMPQLKSNIDSIHIALSQEVLKALQEVHLQNPNPAP